MDVPPDSPKRQKAEEPYQAGAGEPAPPPSSSLNPAALESADEILPPQKEAGAGDLPPAAVSKTKKTVVRQYIDDWGFSEDDDETFEKMRWDTAFIAEEALEFYNAKQGTNYILRNPEHSWCNILPGKLLIHANFKAKNINDPDARSERFFSETVRMYGQPSIIHTCIPVDKSARDIRRGCVYCPSHIRRKSFYHPPMGKSEWGEDKKKDDARLEYDLSSDSAYDEE